MELVRDVRMANLVELKVAYPLLRGGVGQKMVRMKKQYGKAGSLRLTV